MSRSSRRPSDQRLSPPRRARRNEARDLADLYLRARRAVPDLPPLAHTDDEVRSWFADLVLPKQEVWVIDRHRSAIALMVLDHGWLEQLYVVPEHTGQGCGTTLVQLAKRACPEGLDLWAFQSNARAISFYERRGFHEVDRTDGHNEEGAPDVRLRWPGD